MKKVIFWIILIASLPLYSFASEEIVINEIAWMGQKDSYSKEWIELYNNTDTDVNLLGWILKISKTDIPLKGVIPKKSFYLLEHNNDSAVSEEEADLFYKKALNNKGELLLLVDSNKNEIDRIDCSTGWFSGDNKTKQTMERIDGLKNGNDKKNWQKSKDESGTPKRENGKQEVNTKISESKTTEIVRTEAKTEKEEKSIPKTTYLIAGFVAIFSAASVLAVKQLSI